MEDLEKDSVQEFWEKLTAGMTPGVLSECIAKGVVSSLVMREAYGRWDKNDELAKKLGVSTRTVRKLIDGDLDITFELLRKICDVFGYGFKIEFEKAGE